MYCIVLLGSLLSAVVISTLVGAPQVRGVGASNRPIASLVRQKGSSAEERDDFRRDEKELEPPCNCLEPALTY